MNNTEWVNSAGNTFRCIPMKDCVQSGAYWVQMTRKNGTTVGIGQFNNSFIGSGEAEIWINENRENPEYL